ncbi:MAG: hypothetical protein WBX49_00405 [Candidatus Deferrimicrobiaceae bacterium]
MSIDHVQLDIIHDTPLAPDHPPRSDRSCTNDRASAAARSRRYRQRARDGVLVVQIAVPADFVLDLVDSGFLAPGDGEDRAAIADAIQRFLAASRVTPAGED